MTEYLLKFHGRRGEDAFWPHQDDGMGRNAPSLERALSEIEEQVREHNRDLACVLKVDFVDGRYHAPDVTEEFLELLRKRDIERLTEQWKDGLHDSGHNFASLEGYLEMERVF